MLEGTEGGVGAVCKVMKEYEEIARAEERAEGIKKVIAIMRRLNSPDVRIADELVREFGISREEAESRIRMA